MFGAWIVRQQEFSIHDDMLSSKQKSVELEPFEDFHANDVTTSQIIKNVASDAPPPLVTLDQGHHSLHHF
jgi:hypothetical protein